MKLGRCEICDVGFRWQDNEPPHGKRCPRCRRTLYRTTKTYKGPWYSLDGEALGASVDELIDERGYYI